MVRRFSRGNFARSKSLLAVALFFISLSGCASVETSPDPIPTEPPAEQSERPIVSQAQPAAPVDVMLPSIAPFDEAVIFAAHALFSQASMHPRPPSEDGKRPWVIQPLTDGVSGIQSTATREIEARIAEIAGSKYPRFDLQSFSAANVRKSPLVLVGTFTPVNEQGETTGKREAYRVCLALADLNSGTIAAKVTARAYMKGVDHSPTPYFRDSPAWMKGALVDICQTSKPGGPIEANYLRGIVAATLIGEAATAYDHGRYREALDSYHNALRSSTGNRLPIYNGLYLTNLKLGRQAAANEVFGKLVDHGLSQKQLAIKFIFKPGTATYWPDRQVSGSYSMWLKQIARRTIKSNSCLEITGHSSATGPEPLNERLSQHRAEHIKKQLEVFSPQLRDRTIASGAGSRENLVGTGKDDLSDALDRRVVFHVHSCS